jgi:hypothetical protein
MRARMPASLALAAALVLGGTAAAQNSNYNATPYSPVPSLAIPVSAPPKLLPLDPVARVLPVRKGTDTGRSRGGVIPVLMQQRAGARLGSEASEGGTGYRIQLEPPGLERLSLIASDRDFEERIRQEERGYEPMERVQFPDEPVLSTENYKGRGTTWPNMRLVVAPNYVCYERLYFRHLNTEQYGWDLGILQPIISAGSFFVDFALLPYRWAMAPCQRCECSAGYCLPGDPVPLMLYPPELSLTGALAEATTIVGLIAIFP